MPRLPGRLPTRIPDPAAAGLVQMSDANGNLSWQPITAADTGIMEPVAVVIFSASPYTAAPGQFVPVDTTSGAVTVTLPAAPEDATVIGIKHVIQGGSNTVTYSCSGADVFNKAGGSTSGTLTLLSQGVILQYYAAAAIWYVFADDLPLSQLDARYGGLIGQQTLSGTAASITFTSIPQTYTQLRLVAVGASTTAAEATRWFVRVNGDGGSNYDNQASQAANTTAAANPANATQQWLIPSPGSTYLDLPGASATSGVPGMLEVVIPGYTGTTFHKIGMWRSGYSDAATAAGDASVNLATVAWRSTAAITSISVTPVAGSFAAGTFAYLYAS